MKIHFCKSNDLGGLIIRLFTFSRWNHVAIEVGGIVYESVIAGGVRRIPAKPFPHLWAKTESVNVSVESPGAVLAFLNDQVGKPYDWTAIFALPFRKNWQDPDRWFCSELIAEALIAGGSNCIYRLMPYRVTPRDLWVALPYTESSNANL